MSHECPDCGQTCYCGGDWDDCCWDDPESVMKCCHCESGDGDDMNEDYQGLSDEDCKYLEAEEGKINAY